MCNMLIMCMCNVIMGLVYLLGLRGELAGGYVLEDRHIGCYDEFFSCMFVYVEILYLYIDISRYLDIYIQYI